jgi:hypothetical protein
MKSTISRKKARKTNIIISLSQTRKLWQVDRADDKKMKP